MGIFAEIAIPKMASVKWDWDDFSVFFAALYLRTGVS